jgi:ubiquinone biosynthesis protein UbiJ
LSLEERTLLAANVTTRALRTLTRHHLAESVDGLAALRNLAGQVIALRLEPFGKTLFLCPTDEDIQVFTEISGTPDVTIAGNLAAFTRAGLANGSQENLKASGLKICGNAESARQFQALGQSLRIDWQRLFSRLLGANLASSLLAVTDAGKHWARGTMAALQSDVSEYLREEARWLPDRSQTDALLSEIDQVRSDMDRLTARISRLTSTLNAPRLPSSSSDTSS